MKSEFLIAVTQLAAERNLPQDMVVSAVEAALASAYRRDTPSGAQTNVRVRLDPGSGEVEVYEIKTIVDEVEDDLIEIALRDAAKMANGAALSVGETVEFPMPAHAAGRIAAQTAKQVVFQRLREAERELVYAEFAEKSGEVYTATVQRGFGALTVDLNGRATATLPSEEQSPTERYRPGMKMKVIITEVNRTQKGPEIIVSRTHPDLLRRLFEMEVPEIYNGIVEIRGIAREPGSRSKVAVHARQDGVDPVGACVGLRGIRIQNIVNELQGEKIDVIQWSRDMSVFASHALSPAQPLRVDLRPDDQAAVVIVPDRQLSLAIGREGQNARLAAKLTNWKIDIKSSTEIEIERMKVQIEGAVAERESAEAVEAPEPAVAEAPEAAAARAAAVAAEAAEEAAIMAELEAEQAVADAKAAAVAAEESAAEPQAPRGELSPEELLALESLGDLAGADEEIIIEETVEEDVVEEDVWQVAEPVGGGAAIRFAEDILGSPQGGARRGGGRRRGGGARRLGPPNRGGGRPAPRGGPADRGGSAARGGDSP